MNVTGRARVRRSHAKNFSDKSFGDAINIWTGLEPLMADAPAVTDVSEAEATDVEESTAAPAALDPITESEDEVEMTEEEKAAETAAMIKAEEEEKAAAEAKAAEEAAAAKAAEEAAAAEAAAKAAEEAAAAKAAEEAAAAEAKAAEEAAAAKAAAEAEAAALAAKAAEEAAAAPYTRPCPSSTSRPAPAPPPPKAEVVVTEEAEVAELKELMKRPKNSPPRKKKAKPKTARAPMPEWNSTPWRASPPALRGLKTTREPWRRMKRPTMKAWRAWCTAE